MEHGCYYSYLEVDEKQILKNLRNIQDSCDRKIIPVVKGNAWGYGEVEIARLLFEDGHFDTLACSHVIEGIQIRNAGFKKEKIMLLTGMPLHAFKDVVKYDLIPMLYTKDMVRAFSEEVKKAGKNSYPVQLKIDTGLHRIGISPDKLIELVDCVNEAGNLSIIGVCTHYTEADAETVRHQYEIFRECVLALRKMNIVPEYISSGNSLSLGMVDEDICTHTRIGWGYIAYVPHEGYENYYGNKPTCSLRTFITAVYELKSGETYGYSNTEAKEPMKLATISMGISDGLYRPLFLNHSPLLVKGKIAHYLDPSMDQSIIDVTGIDVKIGDQVTIFGKDYYSDMYLSKTEVANACDGNSSILHFNLSPDRVQKVYVK